MELYVFGDRKKIFYLIKVVQKVTTDAMMGENRHVVKEKTLDLCMNDFC